MIEVREIEHNALGRIMKVIETNIKLGTRAVTYVVHFRSHLTNNCYPLRCYRPEDVATGWMVGGIFSTLAEARAALGIDTSPKRESVIKRLAA